MNDIISLHSKPSNNGVSPAHVSSLYYICERIIYEKPMFGYIRV